MDDNKDLIKNFVEKIIDDAKEALDEYHADKCEFYMGKTQAFYFALLDIENSLIEWNPSDTDAEYVEALKSYGFDIDVDAYLATEFKPLTHIFKNYPHRGE